MKTFVFAFLGGILGAVLMDLTEAAMARVGIRSGINVSLVGRTSLRELMTRIDSTYFIQVHRSVMVNSTAIVSATRDDWLISLRAAAIAASELHGHRLVRSDIRVVLQLVQKLITWYSFRFGPRDCRPISR